MSPGTEPGSERATARIGTSGYEYDHWVGPFYPDALPRDRRFEHYSSRFDTVEINSTFYGLPGAETFDAWRERAPGGFVYALKFSHYGTHLKHLKNSRDTIGNFLERARRLRNHLGPILVQLPPNWGVDPDRLQAFLASTPRDVRWTLELRDPSWLCEDVYALLRDAGAALCVHDMIEDHPREVTADWVYLRYHGDGYAGGYSHQKLTADARRIASHLEQGRDVYAYFNNDAGGHAVEDAANLRRYLRRRLSEESRVAADGCASISGCAGGSGCGRPIEKIEVVGRPTYLCPHEQPLSRGLLLRAARDDGCGRGLARTARGRRPARDRRHPRTPGSRLGLERRRPLPRMGHGGGLFVPCADRVCRRVSIDRLAGNVHAEPRTQEAHQLGQVCLVAHV